MLAFKRRCGECFYVDGPALIWINEVSRSSVKVVVEADQSVRIARGEILPWRPVFGGCNIAKFTSSGSVEASR